MTRRPVYDHVVFRELHSSPKSYAEIASVLHCTISTVAGLARQMNLPMRVRGAHPPQTTMAKRKRRVN
jgi:hypothetical protein